MRTKNKRMNERQVIKVKGNDFKRLISLVITITFMVVNTITPGQLMAQTAMPQPPPIELKDIEIDSDIASMHEVFAGPEGAKGKTVIAIQDAHGIFDAQKNIRSLIQELQDNYGFELVALEGGQGLARRGPGQPALCPPASRPGRQTGPDRDPGPARPRRADARSDGNVLRLGRSRGRAPALNTNRQEG